MTPPALHLESLTIPHNHIQEHTTQRYTVCVCAAARAVSVVHTSLEAIARVASPHGTGRQSHDALPPTPRWRRSAAWHHAAAAAVAQHSSAAAGKYYYESRELTSSSWPGKRRKQQAHRLLGGGEPVSDDMIGGPSAHVGFTPLGSIIYSFSPPSLLAHLLSEELHKKLELDHSARR